MSNDVEYQPMTKSDLELFEELMGTRWANADSISRRESGVMLLKGSDLTPEPVRWLWRDWLAQGKLHILAGC